MTHKTYVEIEREMKDLMMDRAFTTEDVSKIWELLHAMKKRLEQEPGPKGIYR